MKTSVFGEKKPKPGPYIFERKIKV